jgi:hypothetical protein
MSLVVAWVGLTFIGLVVLAACAVKVFVAVNGLGRELERARRRLETEQSALRRELKTLQGFPK